ncbi:MAG: GNAT family N-acetyltransferase [Paracoccaceae bacterium]
MSNFIIRAYQPADIEPVMDAWKRANALAHPFLPQDFVDEVEQAIRDIYVPTAETYVCSVDGQVVGFIALLGNEIGGLFLDPAFHGQGLGRAMVEYAVALKGPLEVEVFQKNKVGRRFYDACGFLPLSEEVHEPSGQINCRLAMPVS